MRRFLATICALFIATAAYGQSAGTVTNHAFAVGKGPGVTGYTSLLCASAQLAVGQSGADPICRTMSGDATFSAAGALTFGTVNGNVGTFGSATNCTTITVNAKGLITAIVATPCTVAVGSISGLGAGVATWLATSNSANLRAALTDETGTGLAYFQGGDIGTPSTGVGTNLTALNANNLSSGTVAVARGGTGLGSGTSGGVLYFSAVGTLASSGALTANAITLGGGASGPSSLGSLGTTTTLLHGNAAGAPTFGAVVSADMNITTSTCTNQFVTAISAGGVGTCTTDTLASAQHANQGTTVTVLHGNAAGNPSFGSVSLTADVAGVLPIANGGTGTSAGAIIRVVSQSFCPSGCTTTIAGGGSGTYTPTTGTLYAKVRMTGGGGGGGSSAGTGGAVYGGAGGSAGTYTESVLSAATIGASKAITIGAKGAGGAAGSNPGSPGGTTTLGSTIVTAPGGPGGIFGSSVNIPNSGAAGAAGTFATGGFSTPGGQGTFGAYYQIITLIPPSGAGASAALGTGGAGAAGNSSAVAGNNGTGFGSGGSGGISHNTASTAKGGDGTDGAVFIDDYVSQ